MIWGTPAEKETRRRIRLAVWAYAYEIKSSPVVSDAVFDVECYQVNLAIDTGMPHLDGWFRKNFKPHTGQWIHNHPQLDRIAQIHERFYA
jgi:tRNA/tmRNA/rRNA uracil-C5-methylase (TrmA/RlmC/RlmD family)